MKPNSPGPIFAISFLLLLIFFAVAAGWLAPYSYQAEERGHSYHPPTRIHGWSPEEKFSFRPYVYATNAFYDEHLKRTYREDFRRKYFLNFRGVKLLHVDKPAAIYLFGTDSRGRDIFSRILYGARVSLSIAFLGASLAVFVGFLIGGISGYFGGILDHFLMRLAELFIMIPGLYLLLALRSALPAELGSRQIYILIVGVLSLIGWGGIARVIRGMVLSLRERDFIKAAKVLGKGDSYILWRHLFPQVLPYLAVVMSVSIPGYILGEAALSVLGLGIQEPDVSWGNLLTESLGVARLHFHPWVLTPGVFIILTAFCLNVLGDRGARQENR